MTKIRNYLLYFKLLSIYLISQLGMVILPYYIAYVYKYHKRAREIVLGYWISNKDYDKIFNYLGYKISKINNYPYKSKDGKYGMIDYTYSSDDITGIFTSIDLVEDRSRLYRRLRYYFYFIFIWIWLDDVDNVNGIHQGVYITDHPLHIKLSKNKEIRELLEKTKVEFYSNIFIHNYHKHPSPHIPYTLRLWMVKHQRFNNLERLCLASKDVKSRTIIFNNNGMVYSDKYKKSCFTIFGKNVFDM